MTKADGEDLRPARRVVRRTRGRGHGSIVRLMSPSDLGQVLKPFVFLDLFEANMGQMRDAMQLHPHSGLATVTVFTKGDVRYEDPEAGKGALTYGGVEWMRAGGGIWHGKEIGPGVSTSVQGFQLWIALPPELENAVPDSQYVEASDMKRAGPAFVIAGTYEGVDSPVRAPAGFNYLLVTLKPGESWTYNPPEGHSVGWIALAHGEVAADVPLRAGDMAVFESGETAITLASTGADDAVFVVGSAAPHDHPLHLGYYSVHTTAEALVQGEGRIAELHRRLAAAGDRRTNSGTTPVFR
ncbi:pirin family protein [uncultured Sphingomonas sp.]|uniref:pirin family protein n=1 Tax=uncultured Sphingomonas sp. TaxID=158754 RepID=UPI0035C9A153